MDFKESAVYRQESGSNSTRYTARRNTALCRWNSSSSRYVASDSESSGVAVRVRSGPLIECVNSPT
jgi:hypothetical protein